VNRRKRGLTVIVAMTLTAVALPVSAQDAGSDVSSAKDLTAVIALQGLPCGQVTKVTPRGENDFLATCQDGNKYRVFVDADGRVVVKKQ
jgi:hypothetical protein